MSAPIVESPRVPEIERCDLEKWAAQVNEEILDVCADVQEGGSGRSLPVLTARQALLEGLASGRLQTYSPESERVINVERIGRVADYAKAMQKLAPDGVTRSQFVAIETEIRGWLVSTKQEVSE